MKDRVTRGEQSEEKTEEEEKYGRFTSPRIPGVSSSEELLGNRRVRKFMVTRVYDSWDQDLTEVSIYIKLMGCLLIDGLLRWTYTLSYSLSSLSN